MDSFIAQYGYFAVFLFGFLEACCAPIPSEVTFGFAGVLAGSGKLSIAGNSELSIIGVIVVGTLAELCGSLVSYYVGRVGGPRLVHRFGRYLLITEKDLDRAERFFAGRGAWAVPVGRCMPVIRSFSSIVVGFTEMPVMLFGFLSLIGTAVWVSVIALVGYAVGGQWQHVEKGISDVGYVVAAVAVILIAAFIVIRIREMRREPPGGGGTGPGGGGGRHAPDPASRQPNPNSPMA